MGNSFRLWLRPSTAFPSQPIAALSLRFILGASAIAVVQRDGKAAAKLFLILSPRLFKTWLCCFKACIYPLSENMG